ncbi:hypothetical protein [Acanthopleuribacter pedis]|uniref:Uncharacterized protein n=1 Tax=Acanthopleuribacter pedis TaxID=442870 RepID=A0A8J7QBZ5_9BACT|nr:hypothetical protein [Acanthopleuribacter pedis]MBO1321309.1 hypothetical protein [Acanthopleuribacter pedis]
MSEPMTLDRLEELLETMEPAEIRRDYAAELAADPRCEAMLEHFEKLDANLEALAELEPAPAIPVPRAEGAVVSLPKRRPLVRWLTFVAPLAAALVVALMISNDWHPQQVLDDVPVAAEPTTRDDEGLAFAMEESKDGDSSLERLRELPAEGAPYREESSRSTAEKADGRASFGDERVVAEAPAEPTLPSRQRARSASDVAAKPKSTPAPKPAAEKLRSLADSVRASPPATAEPESPVDRSGTRQVASAQGDASPEPAREERADDAMPGKTVDESITVTGSAPEDEVAVASHHSRSDAAKKSEQLEALADEVTRPVAEKVAEMPVAEAAGIAEQEVSDKVAASDREGPTEQLYDSGDLDSVAVESAPEYDAAPLPRLAQKQAALGAEQMIEVTELSKERRKESDVGTRLSELEALLLTPNRSNRAAVAKLGETRARLLTELENAWQTRTEPPTNLVAGRKLWWPPFGDRPLEPEQWQQFWRNSPVARRSAVWLYPKTWRGDDRLLVDVQMNNQTTTVLVVFRNNRLQLRQP